MLHQKCITILFFVMLATLLTAQAQDNKNDQAKEKRTGSRYRR